jgi:hypothetical protein
MCSHVLPSKSSQYLLRCAFSQRHANRCTCFMRLQDRQLRQAAHPSADANGGAADGSADVELRIAAAVSEAVAAAEAEAGEEMEDLLACLGEWSDAQQH